MTQPVKYARSEGKNIAYHVTGDGPDTLIIINGWVTNLEEFDTLPDFSDWLGDLSSFTKVILFNKRGVGLSDRVNDEDLPTLADRVDDLRAIIDKEQAGMVSLLGISEGGPMALLFASLHPERVRKVIVYGAFAKWLRSDDHTPGIPMDVHRKTLNHIENSWRSPTGLLENTRLTIKEIAYRTGYQVPGSYSKALIRYCGKSPSQIRHSTRSA